MTTKSVKAPANSLSLLLGEYNSDSDHDDAASEAHQKRAKSADQISEAVDHFVSELNSVFQPVGTTNWTKCMDKNTGHPYYWNMETKEVTWDVPVDYQIYLDQNATLLADAEVANMWTVCFADESNTSVYYVNEYTRIVSWNKPIGFVEPEVIVKASAIPVDDKPKPSKNIIKRRRTEKPKRENPFNKDKDDEIEKIELITSFDVKSNSSSDDESKSNMSPTNSLKLKLVATDYNSDDNQTSQNTNLPRAVTQTNEITIKNTSKKPDKKTNTFASIITGGRSPEHALTDLHLPVAQSAVELKPPNGDSALTLDVATPVKMAKRKRRIEFITTVSETSEQEESMSTNSEPIKDNPETEAKFQAGPVEFEPLTTPLECIAEATKEASAASATNGTAQKDVTTLKETIEAKLKFLCDGRPEVPAVQAILIQLETLLEAFDEGALQAGYMLKWLEGIDNDLQTLEADAAPSGWKCLWNRSKSQYCYKHLDTGDIQWEYPGGTHVVAGSDSVDGDRDAINSGLTERDDAMDICMTPPPNVNEQLVLAAGTSKAKCADLRVLGVPDPPKWIVDKKALEPLPPGTDTVQLTDANAIAPACSSTINMELASFYSDLAAIDSTTLSVEPASATVVEPGDATAVSGETIGQTVAADEAVKKKKRKIKKLQPWRSGNLETWINKWQKAQQELDN